MRAAIIGLGILGWASLSFVTALAAGALLKARAAQLDADAVREARVGIGWPKL